LKAARRAQRYASGLLVCAAAALSSCAIFSGKPPLPKHASIERPGSPAAGTDYRAVVDQAAIIYFPEERAASAAKSEPAALLLDAAQQSGPAFAIGWGLIDATQQALLDELQVTPDPARAELIAQLELTGSGRAREHCRSVLRDPRFAAVRHVALRAPRPLVEKLTAGASLTTEERDVLPRGFTAPPGGFQAYAERTSAGLGYNDRALAGAYRAEVIQRQFAAEAIVRQMRSAGADARLIVFASSADFAEAHGVPFYVAQKINVRQLMLDRETIQPTRAPLLTGLERGFRGRFEVVDRTPRSGGD
jgi:hypothetical protein